MWGFVTQELLVKSITEAIFQSERLVKQNYKLKLTRIALDRKCC